MPAAFASSYSPRKLSALSSLAVPELEDSPIASGEAALCDDSFFREVGIPEISCRGQKNKKKNQKKKKLAWEN